MYFKTNICLKIFSSYRIKGQRTAPSFNKDKDWIKQVLVLKLLCFDKTSDPSYFQALRQAYQYDSGICALLIIA